MNKNNSLLKFMLDVLRLMSDYDVGDMLYWRCDEVYAPVTFMIRCNDIFAWACADCEDITPDNLSILEQSIKDCEKLDEITGSVYGCHLFCCRVRNMRPQGAAYPQCKKLWSLFDACGPERDLDFDNPTKPTILEAIPL